MTLVFCVPFWVCSIDGGQDRVYHHIHLSIIPLNGMVDIAPTMHKEVRPLQPLG